MGNKKKIDYETSPKLQQENLEWQGKWKYYKKIEILEAVVLDPKKKSKWEKEVYIKDFSSYFDVKIEKTNWLKNDIIEFIKDYLYKKLDSLNKYWKIEKKTNILNDRVYKLIYNNDVQKIIVNLCSILESNFYDILNYNIYDHKLILIFNNFIDMPKMGANTNKLVNIVKKLYINKELNLSDNKFKNITKKYNSLFPLKYKFVIKEKKEQENDVKFKLQTNFNYINLSDLKRVFNIKSFFQDHESLFSQNNDFEEPDKQALYLNIEDSEGKTLENLETKIFKLWDENKFFVKVILDSETNSWWQKENMKWQEKNIKISWEKTYKYVFFTERWKYLKWSLKNN